MFTIKIIKVGNSLGLTLPKKMLARLKLAHGDEIFITESPEVYRITSHTPVFEEQMNVARKILKRRRMVLRELAK